MSQHHLPGPVAFAISGTDDRLCSGRFPGDEHQQNDDVNRQLQSGRSPQALSSTGPVEGSGSDSTDTSESAPSPSTASLPEVDSPRASRSSSVSFAGVDPFQDSSKFSYTSASTHIPVSQFTYLVRL